MEGSDYDAGILNPSTCSYFYHFFHCVQVRDFTGNWIALGPGNHL